MSFLKIEGTARWDGRAEKGGKYNREVIRVRILKHLQDTGRFRRESREKGRDVRVIKGKKARRNDLIEYFLPTRVRSTF